MSSTLGLNNLGEIQLARGDAKSALQSLQRALSIAEAKLGKDDPADSTPLLDIGRSLVALHRTADAIPYFERALAIRVQGNVPTGEIAEARQELATALYSSRPTRARSLAEARTALAEATQASDSARVKELSRWLAGHH